MEQRLKKTSSYINLGVRKEGYKLASMLYMTKLFSKGVDYTNRNLFDQIYEQVIKIHNL
jgi:hypothetical protein